MKPKISILIPSRLEVVPNGISSNSTGGVSFFIEKAILSIKNQSVFDAYSFQIIVGIDAGQALPESLVETGLLSFAESSSRSQAGALNAASRKANGNFLAILEDDDEWHPFYLQSAMSALNQVDFVSSTQLEISLAGEVMRINDFPTPSGWTMKRDVWEAVGEFNENYLWHLDNEWLGRLARSKAIRAHLVESTAPIDFRLVSQIRPWLSAYLQCGGPNAKLARHQEPYPLVKRLVRPESGMGRIATNMDLKKESGLEYARLKSEFGRIPW